jgi:hypothetical protein
MKKILFAILAVLFAIALIATCDVFEPVSEVVEDVPQFTPDGRPLVRVTIDLGDGGISRSLISSSASTDSNSFEVVFRDSVNTALTYRAHLVDTTQTVLHIPVGNYSGAGKAVAFAGTNQTLLGVGAITSDPNITAATNVTFTLHPLASNAGTTGSSFSAGTSALETIGTYNTFKPFTVSNGTIGKYTVTTLGNSGLTNNEGIIFRSSSSWLGSHITALPGNLGINDQYEPFNGSVTVAGIFTAGNHIDPSGDLNFTIGASIVEPGYTMVSISVPVAAISADNGTDGHNNTVTAGIWYIRGGLDNNEFDEGPPSKGGAVVLKVGIPQIKRQFVDVNVIIEDN